jgi:hypothetical protein
MCKVLLNLAQFYLIIGKTKATIIKKTYSLLTLRTLKATEQISRKLSKEYFCLKKKCRNSIQKQSNVKSVPSETVHSKELNMYCSRHETLCILSIL